MDGDMVWKHGRDLAVPGVVTLAVMGFVAYMWFQGRAQTVEYAVTDSEVSVVDTSSPSVPARLRAQTQTERMLLVDVSWEAAESIDGGSYYVLVAAPRGWRNLACVPECDWATTADLQRYAEALPADTYPVAAQFGAEESGRVRVAFVPGPAGGRPAPSYRPAAWLVQTDGDNVLQAKLIP